MSARSAIRILLADSHPATLAGLRVTLAWPHKIVAEAVDGREALDLVKRHSPDIVFLGISLPRMNGLEATERIVKSFPTVRVIIFTRHDNEAYYWRALQIGASGYVLKTASLAELTAAVDCVMSGEIYLSPEIAHRLRKRLPLHRVSHTRNPAERLTPRQREVLQLIAEGQTTKAIGPMLKISPKTVEYHRAKLMASLSIYDIPGLTRFAVRAGMISEE